MLWARLGFRAALILDKGRPSQRAVDEFTLRKRTAPIALATSTVTHPTCRVPDTDRLLPLNT